MNKISLTINDESIDARFKTYLQGKAVKYLPFHMVQSLMLAVIEGLVEGFTIRFMLVSLYFVCSVIGFITARRYLWTVSYFTILLTEIPIIILMLV